MDALIDLFKGLFSNAEHSPFLMPMATRDISDDEFPTEHTKRDPEIVTDDRWLVHLARKNEWNSQMGEYAPISGGGVKRSSVPLIDLERIGNLVRRTIFTKSVVAAEREKSRAEFGGVASEDAVDELEDEEYIMVYLPTPDPDDLEWKGAYKYPHLNRPLHKERDLYAPFELVFNIEELTLAVPADWEITEKINTLQNERERIKRQDDK